MDYSLTKEANKVNFCEINEDDILGNNKIKVYLVETNVDIYNDIAGVMANKLRENNEKEALTSFILPIGPRGQYRRFAAILMSKELKFYLEYNWQSAVLRKAIFEKPTSSFPVTFLKEHKNSRLTVSNNVLKKYI